MPEPVTLIAGGLLLWAWLKPKPTANPPGLAAAPAASTAGNQPISLPVTNTGPGAPLSTGTSQAAADAGVTLGTVAQLPPAQAPIADITVPQDLAAALDNDTALAMRAYAALNPDDFQLFLDRYADVVAFRNDLMFERLTNPQAPPIEATPQMVGSMGVAAYKVAQALNGVAAGRSVDVFGVAASAAGQIPGMNRDFITALQGAALGYRAFTTGAQALQTISELALANGVGVVDMTAALFGVGEGAGALTAGIAAPIASLGGVLMAVGLVVDIGFTIVGDAPDVQKAIDVALDVASLVCLFIPVVGWVIAIVIQLVKFIVDLFGEDLFGGGMSHEQREVLETARYGEAINPMFAELADAYTPRELWRTIVAWGSGYCGGRHEVAMAVGLVLHAGDQFYVAGQVVTVPPELDGVLFSPGDNEQPGGCYWIRSQPLWAAISNDEQAWLLGAYAATNGVIARAQAGIVDWRKEQFDDPTQKLIMARAAPMQSFLLDHHLSLDQIDAIALEYRAQPHLHALAAAYGWDTWQNFFASTVATEWAAFNFTTSQGSLGDFARQNGFPTMYAFRAAALASFEDAWSVGEYARQWSAGEAAAIAQIQATGGVLV